MTIFVICVGSSLLSKTTDVTEVTAWVATKCCASLLFANGPTMHWVGPKTLVSLKVKGHEINALAVSGSHVNMVIPGPVCHHKFPVLLLRDLVDHPLNLVRLGGMRT